LKSAIQTLGFAEVYEVAQGADTTIRNEADEFEQRLEECAEFMTTSCCASYNEFVKKHLPELKPFVSHTKTPLYYIAEIVKKEHPDAVTVFFSPCVAKRNEVAANPNTDYVINYEELNAWFSALNIDFTGEAEFKNEASAEGRGFANTGGVAKAVQALLPEDIPTQSLIINGLDKDSIKALRNYAATGECDMGNLIEVMACQGGCLGGNAAICAYKTSAKQLAQYVNRSKKIC
jgi:iron only hydrogenase large subunit-like protein